MVSTTYIDDIVTGITAIMQRSPDVDETGTAYKIYNIGNSQPENLLEFVEILQQELKSTGVLPEKYDFDAHKRRIHLNEKYKQFKITEL